MLLERRAQFQCSVKSPDAVAEVDIWWEAGGNNLTNSDRVEVTVSKSSDGNVSSQLSISSVEWSDAGIYSCVAVEVGDDGMPRGPPSKQNIQLDVLGRICNRVTQSSSSFTRFFKNS